MSREDVGDGYDVWMSETAGLVCAEVWGGNRAVASGLSLPGLEGWVVARPHHGDEAGGDVHYISSCGTGRITRVLLADVSGHGQHVAAVGMELRGLMKRYLNHIDPRKLAVRMNREMMALSGASGNFATAVVMTFFSPKGTLSICNAGHPPVMWYRAKRGEWVCVDQPKASDDGHNANVSDENVDRKAGENVGRGGGVGGGVGIVNLPLGVLEESGYVGRELVLDVDDVVMVYTDCLIEAKNDANRMLGVEGLLRMLNDLEIDAKQAGAEAVIDAVLGAIESGGYAWDDDLTTMVLRCSGRSGGADGRSCWAGLKRCVSRVWRKEPIPWPELSWENLGAVFWHRRIREKKRVSLK